MAELMSKAEWQELGIGPKPSETCGAPAFCDPERDLRYHEGVPGDSCFVVGHVTGEDGNTYDFLVHTGAMKLGEGEGVGVSMVSNPAAGVIDEPLSMDDVSRAAVIAAGNVEKLIVRLFERRSQNQ